jgi:hypothetical protein
MMPREPLQLPLDCQQAAGGTLLLSSVPLQTGRLRQSLVLHLRCSRLPCTTCQLPSASRCKECEVMQAGRWWSAL